MTNADDRYQIIGGSGVIEIEVERRRSGGQSVLRVRDFADGMDAAMMEKKLSRIGTLNRASAELLPLEPHWWRERHYLNNYMTVCYVACACFTRW